MECFIPCTRVQNQQWKPAIKQAQFPALLGLVLMAVGLGNSSSYVPFSHPAGIINKHGICYLASVIQALDAVKFALGEGSKAVFGADWGLIGAYNEIHACGGDFRQIPSCIDPDKMVQEWIKLNSSFYKRPFIVKQVKQNDGSIVKEELFPEKIGTGAGGIVLEVFDTFVDQLGEHCTENNIIDPFAIPCGSFGRKNTGNGNAVHRLMYIPRSSFSPDDVYDEYGGDPRAEFLETSVISKQNIVKAPRLLALVPMHMQPHHLPVTVSFEDAKGKLGTYRLLAATYGLPVIQNPEGFVGNHAIAVVRYGNIWYKCDNHIITAFTNEKEFIDWVDEAARTRYEGRGLSSGAMRSITPSLVIYELQ